MVHQRVSTRSRTRFSSPKYSLISPLVTAQRETLRTGSHARPWSVRNGLQQGASWIIRPFLLLLCSLRSTTTSNKVRIFDRTSFAQSCSSFSCSYMETLLREKQLRRPVHQGLLSLPQPMKSIQAYDLRANRIVRLPSAGQTHRLSIVLFYLNGCVPSMAHLTYFSTFASSHRRQVMVLPLQWPVMIIFPLSLKHYYISINCSQNDLDALTELPANYQDIECYTDFSSEQFRCKKKAGLLNTFDDRLLSLSLSRRWTKCKRRHNSWGTVHRWCSYVFRFGFLR